MVRSWTALLELPFVAEGETERSHSPSIMTAIRSW
jgi:hypothetical protein